MIRGWVYERWTEPFTQDHANSPVSDHFVTVDDLRVEEPVSGYNLSAEWQVDCIVDAAKRKGLARIHFIDIEYFSLLGGIFSSKRYIVYGE